MVPLALGFRKLLLRNIPRLTPDDLDQYDSILALRLDYIQQSRLDALPRGQDGTHDDDNDDDIEDHSKKKTELHDGMPIRGKHELKPPDTSETDYSAPSQTNIVDVIKITSAESDAVIRPFRRRFEALHRLWVARRRLAAQLGTLQQIPSTGAGIKNLVGAVVNYQKAQVATFGVLVRERLRDFFGDIKCICLRLVGQDRRHPHGDTVKTK